MSIVIKPGLYYVYIVKAFVGSASDQEDIIKNTNWFDTNKENNEALTITKGKEVLLKPIFLTTGQIILVYKDAVRIYNFSLELLYEIFSVHIFYFVSIKNIYF